MPATKGTTACRTSSGALASGRKRPREPHAIHGGKPAEGRAGGRRRAHQRGRRVAVYYGCFGTLAGSSRWISSVRSALRTGGVNVTVASPFLPESRIGQRRRAVHVVPHRPRARGDGLRGRCLPASR